MKTCKNYAQPSNILHRLTLVIAAIIAISGAGCSKPDSVMEIYVLFPETGFASYLAPVRSGMEMAADDLEARGQLKNRELRLLFADSKSDPHTAKKKLTEFLKNGDPDVIIPVLSSVSLETGPVSLQEEIPMVALVATNPEVPRQNRYTYSYYQSATDEIRALEPMVNYPEVKSLAVIHQDDAYGQAIYHQAGETFSGKGIRVLSAPYPAATQDISNQVLLAGNSDAILIAGFEAGCIAALEEIRNQNFPGLILGTSTMSTEIFLEMEEAQGIIVASPSVYNPGYSLVKDLKLRYEEEFNQEFHHNAAAGYDVITMLGSLAEELDKVSPENILRLLEQEFVFPGLFGDVYKSRGQRSFNLPLVPVQFREGERIFLQ
ncbi:ABC transporter substrate-binding protein [Salinispira pacifica]|nr:ABC transporter substrate-binding protein [Salinispira pacifica]